MSISHSYLRLPENGALPTLPNVGQLGVAIVADIPVSNSRQNEIANWLYSSGCRYASTWGVDCSIWHDAMDWAEIAVWPNDVPDNKFMMTTWHEDEPLDEMFWFIGNAARTYDDKALDHILILNIGDTDRDLELRTKFAKALDA